MSDAHRRAKNPDLVRQSLVKNACRLASEKGLMAVSIQQVSSASGVTKGAFFHHFSNKQALIDAVFEQMMSEFDHEIQANMAADPVAYGRFSRAYLRLVTEVDAKDSRWISVWVSMIADDALRAVWHAWFNQRFMSLIETESSLELQAVRMAADGIWLSQIAGNYPSANHELHEFLLRMTHP